METKNDENMMNKIINSMNEYINNNPKICERFNCKYSSQKYTISDLLPAILYVLKENISWRFIEKLKISKQIHWNTFYKMHQKLVKFKIYDGTYKNILKKYYEDPSKIEALKTRMTDTTVIVNKQGIDKVHYNKAYPKHKISKVSFITDNNKVVLNVKLFSGNINDSKIFVDQLNSDNLIDTVLDENNRDVILGDSAYDSNIIRNKLAEQKYKKLICPKNKRNTKNKEKLKKLKMNVNDKKIFKNRIKIEHKFCNLKQNKRIQIRYDKKSENYLGFVYLALSYDLLKYT